MTTTWKNGAALLAEVKWNAEGHVPAVVQDVDTRQVLTLCYLTREALEKTLATGTVYVYRRSLKKLMQKGETSGHIQLVREVLVDCEGKSLVFLVKQHVAACHTGYFTCYFRRLSKDGTMKTIGKKIFNPDEVYRR